MSSTQIPFLDLVSPHVEMEEELVSVFRTALKTAAFIGGKAVEDFENAFAEFCEVDHCVGVGSGTDALRFALMAAGVRPGIAYSPCRTPSSRPPKPFRRLVRIPSSSISMSAPTTWTRKTPRISGDEVRPDQLLEGRFRAGPVERFRRSCRFIFTDRRLTWIRFWNWPRLQPDRGGRCVPGPWSRVLLAKGATLAKQPARWGKQQPSASIRARISALAVRPARSQPTMRNWRKNPHAARPRPGGEVLSRYRRLQR